VKRRLVAVLAGGLALLGVSSCSAVRPNAAKVGDVDIRRNEFERDMQKLSGTATASTDQVRTWLTDRIRFEAATRAVSDQHLTVTDANRTKGEALAKSEWSTYDALPAGLKTRLQDGFGAEIALAATVPTPDETVKEALGGQDGELCLTAIPAKSEDDAKAAVAELASGKALADVVGPRVAGGELESTHGALLTPEGVCPTASQFTESVTNALADVKVNTASAPIPITGTDSTGATTTTWFVIVPTKAGDPDAKAIVSVLKAAAANVSVDARYGQWDPETQTVVASAPSDLG
jgi:hypothetical protein